METWLVDALKQGGLLALAVVALWLLDRVWKDRLRDQVNMSDELKSLIQDTRKALENNTRLIAAFMERYEMPGHQPASSHKITRPLHPKRAAEEESED
jgi:hypothetical protein